MKNTIPQFKNKFPLSPTNSEFKAGSSIGKALCMNLILDIQINKLEEELVSKLSLKPVKQNQKVTDY